MLNYRVGLGQTTGSTRNYTGWLVDNLGPYGINSLRFGLLTGYSTHAGSTSIIIENIMIMNDSRNGTDHEHQCVTMGNMMIQDYSDTIFLLYVTLLVSITYIRGLCMYTCYNIIPRVDGAIRSSYVCIYLFSNQ